MTPPVIDALQYCNWSRARFEELRAGGVDAVHVTVAYHEELRELIGNLSAWNRHFEAHGDLILRGLSAGDIRRAQKSGRTAVFFGLQTPLPIADDLGLVEILHQLGIRFMQLTYNNQSLLGTGHAEASDNGLTRFGHMVVAEMNRVGLVIDLSHAGPKTAAEAIAASTRPVTITHANPHIWHPATRNIPQEVLAALFEAGGMLGFSLYPHHLKGGSDCTLEGFCEMVAEVASRFGAGQIGIGSDLCRGQPDAVVQWMRTGRWSKAQEAGAVFPAQPDWFQSSADFPGIAAGLAAAGLSAQDVAGIMGGNWMRFFEKSFGPQ